LPIILATWEAEIRKIVVPGQPSQEKEKFAKGHLSGKKLGLMVYAYLAMAGRLK
jgi:hypothetical protein